MRSVHAVRQCGEEEQKERAREAAVSQERSAKAPTAAPGREGRWEEPDRRRKKGVMFSLILYRYTQLRC